MEKMQATENYTIDDLNLISMVKALWERKLFIFIFTSVFIIIGIIYVFFIATPLYRATTTLYPTNQEKSTSSQLQVLATQFGFGGISSSDNYNITDVVKSRMIIKKIIDKKWKTSKNNNKEVYLYDFWDIKGANAWIRKEKTIERIKELISVEKDKETGLISISILTEEPQLSADIVNYIVVEATNYIIEAQQKSGAEKRIFIEQRLVETKNELNNAEEALKEFREKNRAIFETPELQLEYERLLRNIDIKLEIYLTLQKQKELALIEEKKDTPIINVLDIGEMPLKKAKPHRAVLLIIFSLSGIILSVISSFLIDQSNYFLKS